MGRVLLHALASSLPPSLKGVEANAAGTGAADFSGASFTGASQVVSLTWVGSGGAGTAAGASVARSTQTTQSRCEQSVRPKTRESKR